MTVEAQPAPGQGGGEQQQAQQLQVMPHADGSAAAPAAAPGDAAGVPEDPTPPANKRQRRGQKEVALLGGIDGTTVQGGRPSRRAANAAQAAIAQAAMFEQHPGADLSPPRVAEQALAMRLMESTVEHAEPAMAAVEVQPGAQADGHADGAAAAAATAAPQAAGPPAAAAPPEDDAPPPGAGPTPAEIAAAAFAEAAAVAGSGHATRKRRRPGEPAAAAAPEAPPPAPASGGAVAATPLASARQVEVSEFVEMARQCESQDVLRDRLLERFPPTRGRSVHNQHYRDLFAALCPDQIFHNRQSSMAQMTYRLFQLAGKAMGKAPAPYKPRGPRSPVGAAGGTPGVPAPHGTSAEVTPHAGALSLAAKVAAEAFGGAAGAAGASRGARLGPAAGLAAEQGLHLAGTPASSSGNMAGPAAAASARAAAAAADPTPGGLAAAQAMRQVVAEYPTDLVRLAALVRQRLGVQKGATVHLRLMLKTGLLTGQAIRFQTKAGRVQNHGLLVEGGGIRCFCRACGPAGRDVSASEFEEHSGSKDRRPADGIFLESCNRTLKDLLNLINSPEMAACTSEADVHMEVCHTCKAGGQLLGCDGCPAAFHLPCVNLDAQPAGDWFCPLCAEAGINSKPEPLPLQPKQVGMLKPLKSSGKARPSSSGRLSIKGRGGSGEGLSLSQGSAPPPPRPAATGRVHMAAPTAPRMPRLGRPGARSNKNKRLFEGEEGALVNGQKLFYRTTQGETLLEGTAVVEPGGPSGILCGCCSTLISASGFEAHAGRGQRRAPYDNIFTEDGLTLKAMAAMLPDLPEEGGGGGRGGGDYGLDDMADDAREVISELDTMAGGCVLCHELDFQRGGFGPRTIMLCDQCEREFHVGCLRKCGVADLEAVPEGEWFCSEECQRIRANVNAAVQAQQMDIPGHPGHTWQVMRGKDGRTATSWSLRTAQEILQESFDPIMDLGSNTDLLPVMLYARRAGEWDYSNCLTLLLRHKGKPVVAAICRVFGPQMAELPLVATKQTARRQGHARVLVNCFEQLLKQSGVHTLVLPAAHETVETWKNGFAFRDMPEEEVRLAKQQLRILIFPGTEVLYKQYEEVPPPEGHHVLMPPPPKPSEQEAADCMEVAFITANMVACVSAFQGEPILPESLGMAQAAPASTQPAALAPTAAATTDPGAQPTSVQPAAPAPQAAATAAEADAEVAAPMPAAQAPAVQPPDQLAPEEEAIRAANAAGQAPPLDEHAAMVAAAIAAGSDAAAAQAAAAAEPPAQGPVGDAAPVTQQMDVDPPASAPAGEAAVGAEPSPPLQLPGPAEAAEGGAPADDAGAVATEQNGPSLPLDAANGIPEMAEGPLHDSISTVAAGPPFKQLRSN